MQKMDGFAARNYHTDHLYLAAYLTCSGHPIIGTTWAGDRLSFVFCQTAELSADAANFMSGGSVPARRFAFELLELKRMLPRSKQTMEKNENNSNEINPR
jgi:hypothetical protein